MDYHQELFSNPSKKSIFACAKKLNLFKRGQIVFPTNECADMFVDFFIYSWPSKADCPIAKSNMEDNTDLIAGTQNNVFSIFEVSSLGNSKVRATDIFRDGMVGEVYDFNLSRSISGEYLFASRLLKFPDFSCFSGIGLPVFSGEMLDNIHASVKHFLKKTKSSSVAELKSKQETEFEALILKACLKYKTYEFFSTEYI
jgi:hypothetical protein